MKYEHPIVADRLNLIPSSPAFSRAPESFSVAHLYPCHSCPQIACNESGLLTAQGQAMGAKSRRNFIGKSGHLVEGTLLFPAFQYTEGVCIILRFF